MYLRQANANLFQATFRTIRRGLSISRRTSGYTAWCSTLNMDGTTRGRRIKISQAYTYNEQPNMKGRKISNTAYKIWTHTLGRKRNRKKQKMCTRTTCFRCSSERFERSRTFYFLANGVVLRGTSGSGGRHFMFVGILYVQQLIKSWAKLKWSEPEFDFKQIYGLVSALHARLIAFIARINSSSLTRHSANIIIIRLSSALLSASSAICLQSWCKSTEVYTSTTPIDCFSNIDV